MHLTNVLRSTWSLMFVRKVFIFHISFSGSFLMLFNVTSAFVYACLFYTSSGQMTVIFNLRGYKRLAIKCITASSFVVLR